MAKYKNREVAIVQELPSNLGDQVMIEHLELTSPKMEIVARNQVVVSQEELDNLQKARDERAKASNAVDVNEFRVEGTPEAEMTRVPTAQEVQVQRLAEKNLIRAEDQAADNKAWQEQHPNLPVTAKQQLDAIKVVPYLDETEKATKSADKRSGVATTAQKSK